jgi:hypothetical protein
MAQYIRYYGTIDELPWYNILATMIQYISYYGTIDELLWHGRFRSISSSSFEFAFMIHLTCRVIESHLCRLLEFLDLDSIESHLVTMFVGLS